MMKKKQDYDQPRQTHQNAEHNLAEDNTVEKRAWENSEEDPDNDSWPSPRRPSQVKKTRSLKTT